MPTAAPDLSALRTSSGVLAMLAVDQREALRAMLADAGDGRAIPDDEVRDFKLRAARNLTPHASAVLIDRQFALEAAVANGAVADGCALIVAADDFRPAHGELVGEVGIDRGLSPERARELGAVAMKLLVLWRPDQDPLPRIEMVGEFVARCRAAGLLSIVEPVSRRPVDPDADWDWNEGVLAAADELGDAGQDLYKGEVPLHGTGDLAAVARHCREMTSTVDSPWVVLSSGVAEADFERAVATAVSCGAEGFLAGRAVWRSCLTAADPEQSLRTDAVGRLRAFTRAAEDARAAREPEETPEAPPGETPGGAT